MNFNDAFNATWLVADTPLVRYYPKLNGKWPTGTFLQTRLSIVRANPLYQNLYTDVKKEGDCNGRK